MHPLDTTPDQWDISSAMEEDGEVETYQHKTSGLKFLIRHNPDHVLQFKILEGNVVRGDGYQTVYDKDAWVKNFIYDGQFNVFLSKKKMRLF